MAHFNASGDRTASLVIFVKIGFEPCNNLYLVVFVLPGRLLVYVARCCVSYHGYLSFDPFFGTVASLRAMQCVKLKPPLVTAV